MFLLLTFKIEGEDAQKKKKRKKKKDLEKTDKCGMRWHTDQRRRYQILLRG